MKELSPRNWLQAVCGMLSALLISLLVLNYARSEALSEANNRIGAIYQKAFYETCELTEGISSNYRKLLVSSDSAQMQSLLGEISRQCQGVSGNLALLPLGEKTVSATLKFINQAEDFAENMSISLAAGDGVTPKDYDTMLALSDAAAQFTSAMSGLLERYERGEAVFDAAISVAEEGEGLHPLTGGAADYPTLLYDGPFSDGITGGRYEMLSGAEEITPLQAENVLKALLPLSRIQYLGESMPEIACYDFSLQSGRYTLSAGITKFGGQLLYLLPENAFPQEKLSAEALCTLAEDFLREKGYGEMEASYYSAYGGVITINFAAVQDSVVLYPDLIKLQLSMEDGSVIGLDARGYLKNHRPRSFAVSAIDASEAMNAVGSRLAPESARLCVIPQNRQEYLCYEVSAMDGAEEFLVYIDAQTGAERNLLQVLSRENGTLVM